MGRRRRDLLPASRASTPQKPVVPNPTVGNLVGNPPGSMLRCLPSLSTSPTRDGARCRPAARPAPGTPARTTRSSSADPQGTATFCFVRRKLLTHLARQLLAQAAPLRRAHPSSLSECTTPHKAGCGEELLSFGAVILDPDLSLLLLEERGEPESVAVSEAARWVESRHVRLLDE